MQVEPLTRPARRPTTQLMSPTERFLTLRRLGFFSGADDAHITIVAHHAREVILRAGTVLFDATTPPDTMHIIVDGAVEVERDGKHVVTVLPGYGVGALGIYKEHDGSVARVEHDTLALALDYEVWNSIMEDHFTFVIGPLKGMSSGIAEMLADIGGHRVLGEPSTQPWPEEPLDLVQRIFEMRRGDVFADSSVHAVAEMAQYMEERRYAPGDVLWSRGDPADGVFCLVHGTVSVKGVEQDWSETVYPGSFIGGIATLAQQPRRGTATAVTPVLGLKAPPELLMDTLEDNFDMATRFLGMIATVYTNLQTARAAMAAAPADQD
jgi:CRP-like cAMP-binding protein